MGICIQVIPQTKFPEQLSRVVAGRFTGDGQSQLDILHCRSRWDQGRSLKGNADLSEGAGLRRRRAQHFNCAVTGGLQTSHHPQ